MARSQPPANDVQGAKHISPTSTQAPTSRQAKPNRDRRHSKPSPMLILRLGLPGSLMVAGVVLLLVDSIAIGLVLVSVAMISVLVDFFARLTISSGEDREREERARNTFARTGSWPRRRT